MNLKLYAIKNSSQRAGPIQLVVVDLDRSKYYPLNFVCVLPRYFRILERRSSKFAKLFGIRSHDMAKKLLIDASRQEPDPEIQNLITKRLKDINAVPTASPKGVCCGQLVQ
ncbi:MAG: hypothetical protein LBH74_03075 [Nitrososphaerota archaeon]|jgi:hypothetical protein|uniref:hypothetical protein n=1 Tax=Candidatus Bathycorpusculum sp. TaxID=2994959 RepID=UPI00282DA7FE|nr:hypothetical protein [Candidatus Termitimicrobium sp.]MCL2432420.1 hypothetical protein [Candidatus Termitimicrobium sp.]MDR0492607.1 hypothetical protein [Nitrososphaerota archaeon]